MTSALPLSFILYVKISLHEDGVEKMSRDFTPQVPPRDDATLLLAQSDELLQQRKEERSTSHSPDPDGHSLLSKTSGW